MKWLVVLVTGFVLMFGGGVIGAENRVVDGILSGIESTLQAEVKAVEGTVHNQSHLVISWGILGADTDIHFPVLEGTLSPDGRALINLEAGEYVIAVVAATEQGEVRAVKVYLFTITPDATQFNLRIRVESPSIGA